jgi:hypothetical protein
MRRADSLVFAGVDETDLGSDAVRYDLNQKGG